MIKVSRPGTFLPCRVFRTLNFVADVSQLVPPYAGARHCVRSAYY